MDYTQSGFKFLKVKNGKPHFAIVKILAERCNSENQIIEDYSGQGFKSQGYIESVPAKGYEDWKIAARRGIEFVLNLTTENWKVIIESIEGRIALDTNPTIVGYVTILAFCDKINLELDKDYREKLDIFVFESWIDGNDIKIPNFKNLNYN